jgi:hypothetical protein
MDFMLGKATPASGDAGPSASPMAKPQTNLADIMKRLSDLEQRVKALEGDESTDDQNEKEVDAPAPEHVYKQSTPSPFGMNYKR